ncbi:MAG: T9SS type A sorting domain-containing protein, partial [Gemmatimonadetes bacterium]|nr:T9SS type A sorting domain-containing protein [Gemmatimonadota bacterium]
SNEYLNTRLDRLINAAIDDGAISNFEAMTCYFTNNLLDANHSFSSPFSALSGESSDSLPDADLYCEGPLRPAGIAIDQDGDGVEDDQDDFPTNPLAWSDGDGDGVIDPEEVEFPDGDLDGDGISNLREFQYGTDPMDPSSIPPRVDLSVDLRNESYGELVTNAERTLRLYTSLRFSQGVASNVLLTWSASLPLRLEEVHIPEHSVPCETVEINEQTGTINCGNLQFKDLVDLWLTFTPLQAGLLDFTVEFSADELEINPADNVRSLQSEIAPDPAQALTELPDSDRLAQNAPNPFNSQTVLSYFLHAPGPTRLEVFSLTGQRIAVLHQGLQQAGYHRLRWNGHDDAGRPVASGLYLYRLVTNEAVLTRKLVLLR